MPRPAGAPDTLIAAKQTIAFSSRRYFPGDAAKGVNMLKVTAPPPAPASARSVAPGAR
jgi:hypothetical protein